MLARLRKRPLEAALAGSCALHVIVLAALLGNTPSPSSVRLAALPPMDVVLARAPASMTEHTSQGGTRPSPLPILEVRRSPVVAPLSTPGPPPVSPIAPPEAGQLTAALRNSSIACPLLGGVYIDPAARSRCHDRLGANLASTRRINGIPPEKSALYDEVAFEQEEARAFSYRPTASTVRPVGAGEIGGGPASDEIFAHNVGDPTPPKDPLLKREARRLGPALP